MAALRVPTGTDTTGGYSLGVLATVDPDAGDTHTYTITGGADAEKFSIGGAGDDELILTDGVLDAASQPTYVVLVTTTDAGGLDYEKQFTVTVTAGGTIAGPVQPTPHATTLSTLHSPLFCPIGALG